MFTPTEIHSVIANWSLEAIYDYSADQGLINHTWIIGRPPKGVLQWVNPIFDPNIHYNIDQITKHLHKKNITTPQLIKTNRGQLYIDGTGISAHGGSWRMLEFIPGVTHNTMSSTQLAYQAGKLVGKFHEGLSDCVVDWKGTLREMHNTQQRMKELTEALHKATGHHLEKEAVELGQQILRSWQNWSGNIFLPKRICHGDLKISNLHFDKTGVGVCLLDLDTLGMGDYSIEMGDAWRSWCNTTGESDPTAASFNLDIFASSVQGWLEFVSPTAEEKEALVPGIERICLELASRFCADAINNNYFKEDIRQFPTIGTHNLCRAQTQFNLAQSVLAQRTLAEEIVQQYCR